MMVQVIRNGRLVEVATGQAARDERRTQVEAETKRRRELMTEHDNLRAQFLEAVVEARLNRVVSKMVRGGR